MQITFCCRQFIRRLTFKSQPQRQKSIPLENFGLEGTISLESLYEHILARGLLHVWLLEVGVVHDYFEFIEN